LLFSYISGLSTPRSKSNGRDERGGKTQCSRRKATKSRSRFPLGMTTRKARAAPVLERVLRLDTLGLAEFEVLRQRVKNDALGQQLWQHVGLRGFAGGVDDVGGHAAAVEVG
jgi:hypothetical protein